jgi:hypothetical protein
MYTVILKDETGHVTGTKEKVENWIYLKLSGAVKKIAEIVKQDPAHKDIEEDIIKEFGAKRANGQPK